MTFFKNTITFGTIYKYENWLKIWVWLDNVRNIKTCLSILPKSKQEEYCNLYNINKSIISY